MLPFLLLAVALVGLAAAVLVVRRRRPIPPAATEQHRPRNIVLAESIPAPATISGDVEAPPPAAASPSDALDTLDALLAELESTTGRIDGADALDGGSVAELEGLAARLEAAAESLAAR